MVSEDRQNLSVAFPPAAAPGDDLPVMVYLHGGSYVVGSGDGARYLPTRLVLDEQVIVVTVTYLGRGARRLEEKLITKGTRELYATPAEQLVARHRGAGGVAASYLLRPGHPLNYPAGAHCTELGLLFDNPAWAGDNLLVGLTRSDIQTQGSALRGIWVEYARTGTLRRDLAAAARLQLG